MSFLNRLKKVFSSKSDVKAIESIDNRFKSIEEPLEKPAEKLKPMAVSTSLSNYSQIEEEPRAPEVQKDSYELGLAAGYTGRSIKEIEVSLSRIEGQMVTKDWFTVQLQQLDRRVEDIERAMGIIKGAIPAMEQQKKAIVKRMPLTQRMEELLAIVKQEDQISFADLALRMKIDISDLRSLLSIMTKRTDEIERFRVHRTGWIRYTGANKPDSAPSTSDQVPAQTSTSSD